MIHNLKSSKTNNKITDKYYNKYLKYKLKYLNLIHGGMMGYEPQVKKENVKIFLLMILTLKMYIKRKERSFLKN